MDHVQDAACFLLELLNPKDDGIQLSGVCVSLVECPFINRVVCEDKYLGVIQGTLSGFLLQFECQVVDLLPIQILLFTAARLVG